MDIIHEIVRDKETMTWVILGVIAMVAIGSGTIAGVIKSAHRERTRREIAAYIAEGSMTPEQGEKLIRAKFRED